MKKVKMIVKPLVVLAIVGSVFAFRSKKVMIFCVTSNLGSNTCSAIVKDRLIVTGTPNFNHIGCWDGDLTKCVGTNNCTTPVRLDNN